MWTIIVEMRVPKEKNGKILGFFSEISRNFQNWKKSNNINRKAKTGHFSSTEKSSSFVLVLG